MPDDYTFKAGHQIGVIVVGDYRDISTVGTAGTTITIDTRASKIVLPVVGGHDAAAHSGAFTDTVAPALTVPQDIVVDATGDDGAVVTYPDPGVTDNLDPAPTASCTPASGAQFPLGTTTVTCTAQDANGNVATDTFTVTVSRTEPATPPQDDIPAPPPPSGGGGDGPVPPTPTGGNQPPSSGGSGKAPTLDTVDKLAPKLASLAFVTGRHSLKAKFKLSETATVTMAVYKHGSKRALKTTRKRLGKGRRSLKVTSSRLVKGRYTIKFTAVDAAGNARHVSKVVRIRR
jgi:X-Pro dipeptidyl-peptidase